MADGFSCRTQIEQSGTGQAPVHLAEVLAAGLHGTMPRPRCAEPPGVAVRTVVVAVAAGAAGLALSRAMARAHRS